MTTTSDQNTPAAQATGALSADLTGRVAIVTGASSGLGARFAETLAANGALVIASARRVERLQALADRVPGIEPVACDVTNHDDRRALVDGTLARHGRVDILVNNAGRGGTGTALEETLESFENDLALNLTAPFVLAQLCGRAMVEQGAGSIINVASILGLVSGSPLSQPSYAASKGGLVNLTRELAVSLARTGVRVNGIAPGWFPTEATEGVFATERGRDWMIRNIPMRRTGEESDLDGALLLLASDASRYITGQTLVVDGGWTSR